ASGSGDISRRVGGGVLGGRGLAVPGARAPKLGEVDTSCTRLCGTDKRLASAKRREEHRSDGNAPPPMETELNAGPSRALLAGRKGATVHLILHKLNFHAKSAQSLQMDRPRKETRFGQTEHAGREADIHATGESR